jgi:hypothetical protein
LQSWRQQTNAIRPKNTKHIRLCRIEHGLTIGAAITIFTAHAGS